MNNQQNTPKITTRASVQSVGEEPIAIPNGNQKVKIETTKRPKGKK
jgi:hypothetical protein